MSQVFQTHLELPRTVTQVKSTVMRYLWVVGVFLALGGEIVLLKTRPNTPTEGWMQALGVILFVIGGLCFGVGRRDNEDVRRKLVNFAESRLGKADSAWYRWWAAIWTVFAIGLGAIAAGWFVKRGEGSGVIITWLASILALFVGQIRRVRITRPRITHRERLHVAILAVLLIILLATRAPNLTTLPYNLDGDFADVGLQARALVTGEVTKIFTYGWAAIPMLGYLPPWFTMKLFGTGLLGLNASGVVEGLLIIIGVYLLGRELFRPRVGLLAAGLMTISYTFLAASRQSSYIDPVFFVVYALYFLLIGLRGNRRWAILLSGVLTALSIQMYYSGRIIAFIIGFLLVYLLLVRRPWLRAILPSILLWGVAVLISLGPMLVLFIRDSGAFMDRTRTVFILNPEIVRHMEGVFQVDTIPAMLVQQARHTALMFHYYPGKDTQFALEHPFLDWFSGSLFVLGLGYALFHLRRLGSALIAGWTALGVIIGCFLTVNPPFWPRLLILLPPTMLLGGLALDMIYEQARSSLRQLGRQATWIAPAAVVLLFTWVGVQNWNTYVDVKGAYATPRTRIARYLAELPPDGRGYLVSQDFKYMDREFAFLAPGRMGASLPPGEVEEVLLTAARPVYLILTAEQNALIERLQERFPEGVTERHIGNRPEEVAFYVLKLP